MMYPTDFSYWEKLKAFVDYEPVEAIAPEVRGMLASMGIIKGVPKLPHDPLIDGTMMRELDTLVVEIPAREPLPAGGQQLLGRPSQLAETS
jgi:hypothetical protein